MGNSIDKIDDGFFICGVDALADHKRLHSLGITHILNAASASLYDSRVEQEAKASLQKLRELFTVKALECNDVDDCNISIHFQELAEFVEQGRKAGGVVVHCAAGISRASTSSCAYLMIKEHLSLAAAFQKVHSVRNVVEPNPGFWRQLRDLEAVLEAQGADLQPLDPELRRQADETAIRCADQIESGCVDTKDFGALLAQLDFNIRQTRSFVTQHLTARVTPEEGLACKDLAARLRSSDTPGVVWEEMEPVGQDVLGVRAMVVPSMDGAAFKALIEQTRGVGAVVSESTAGE